ncbi:hypothetical protein Moror_10905 [Moniliophthora roreri MCA 2997]|uniref:Uncharacterized protein n=1 Tax=Moniliophthora roreri (strain MCA 2997) TaxID=1381753 RepID=V2X574_MONRO|nr:hypothetical protein Moror_10905 [Moniliophthora roreri MCA 2997]
MAAAFQPPSSAYGPYAILKNMCVNSTNRYSTTDFLWLWTHDVDEGCRIEKVTLLKCNNGKQHELVAVSVIVPSKVPCRYPNLTITIFFERRIGHGKDLEQGEFDEESRKDRRRGSGGDSGDYAPAVLPRPILASSGFSMDIPENKAKDIVIIPSGDEWKSLGWERAFEVAFNGARRLDNIHNEIHVVYTITFPKSDRPSIIDLAVLLNQVSESYTDYHIFGAQCYFYAALVCETMRELFKGQKILGNDVEEPSTSESKGMDFSRIDVESAEPTGGVDNVRRQASGSKNGAGRYKILPIVSYKSSRFQTEVKKMCESFPEKRQAKIDDLKKNQVAELLQAREEIANERQARLEERREKEALQKRLDEERRQKEEECRQKEEECRQKEEERRQNKELSRQLAALKAQQSPGSHLPSADA